LLQRTLILNNGLVRYEIRQVNLQLKHRLLQHVQTLLQFLRAVLPNVGYLLVVNGARFLTERQVRFTFSEIQTAVQAQGIQKRIVARLKVL
jgi:hypothetical protein